MKNCLSSLVDPRFILAKLRSVGWLVGLVVVLQHLVVEVQLPTSPISPAGGARS